MTPDYFEMLAPVPVDRAFRPMSEGRCPLVRLAVLVVFPVIATFLPAHM